MSLRPLRALPLRWRLSIVTAVLVLAALVVTSAAVVALVRSSLIHQIDEDLHDAAYSPFTTYQHDGGGDTAGPTDYFVGIVIDDVAYIITKPTTAGGDTPRLPDLATLRANEPVTVGSTDGSGPSWRLCVYPRPDGAVAVLALPLTSVDDTTKEMLRTMTIVGIAVVVLAALAGYVAVQRALRPLRDIEAAAGAVAAGDLARRAPLEPPSTEVGRLGMSFNAMVAELERAFAERAASEARMRRFVSDASHELRTPLASMRGYGELYRMGAVPPEEVPTTMARIESEATRMGVLVNDLLALARLDEGRGLQLGDVDLVAIARDAVADLRALDPSRRTELQAEAPVTIHADGDKIRQVVTNLVGNTVQHTPPGTAVEIAVRASEGWATLEVRDHGPGIAAEDSARVFERFYRPDTSRTRASGGSGLGLAIVATIVAAHGGSVRHEPTPGGGATMVVRLPLGGPSGARPA